LLGINSAKNLGSNKIKKLHTYIAVPQGGTPADDRLAGFLGRAVQPQE